MAEIVLGLAASHGSSTFAPSSTWELFAARDRRRPYYEDMLAKAPPEMEAAVAPERLEERYQAGQRAQAVLNDLVDSVAPDVIVIFGDDQHEQFLDDNMPMFCVYRGSSMSRGTRRRQRDEYLEEGSVPPQEHRGAPELAEHLIRCLVNAEVDIATSNELKPDLGLVTPSRTWPRTCRRSATGRCCRSWSTPTTRRISPRRGAATSSARPSGAGSSRGTLPRGWRSWPRADSATRSSTRSSTARAGRDGEQGRRLAPCAAPGDVQGRHFRDPELDHGRGGHGAPRHDRRRLRARVPHAGRHRAGDGVRLLDVAGTGATRFPPPQSSPRGGGGRTGDASRAL